MSRPTPFDQAVGRSLKPLKMFSVPVVCMGLKIAYLVSLANALYGERKDLITNKVLADQVKDICDGLRFSMPISSILSALILFVQIADGHIWEALVWFLLVNAINGARVIDAVGFSHNAGVCEDAASLMRMLIRFQVFSVISGLAWSGIAILAEGFTTAQSSFYLVILAGICAGAVTYGSSYAVVAISFITPPLIVITFCLLVQAKLEYGVLAFAVVLFWFGLMRSSLLGQKRFVETSRLQYEAEQTATEMAIKSEEDPLTGLLNRRGLERSIQRFAVGKGPFHVMLIDLDGFKSVNDTYGHKAGDNLLVAITERIRNVAPRHSVLARIGGDEFVLLYCETMTVIEPGSMAKQIISSIAGQYQGMLSIEVGACVGICRLEQIDPVEMLLRADFALYAAKKRGRNEYYVFDARLQQEWERKQSIERDLRVAIDAGQVHTCFQPVVDLRTGEVIGFEALLRWDHPEHGTVAPPEIIAIAREVGAVHQLTESVLLNCCQMIAMLCERGRNDVTVAINLSPRELAGGRVAHEILSRMKERGVPIEMLEVEITEEAPFDQRGINASLAMLANAGISIALDDFGTGFATFASLKKGRFNKIKIDKVFVRGISQSKGDQYIVSAIVKIAAALDIKVTAEGVETEDDRATLCQLGCDSGQGFLFFKALPRKVAIETLLRGQIALPPDVAAGL